MQMIFCSFFLCFSHRRFRECLRIDLCVPYFLVMGLVTQKNSLFYMYYLILWGAASSSGFPSYIYRPLARAAVF